MVNFRQIFLAIACSALLWAAHTQAATVSSAAATKRAMVLASFCAPDGDKAAALERVLGGDLRLPAARVSPRGADFLVDAAALGPSS